MPDIEEEKANNLISEISDIQIDEIVELSFELFDKSNNRTTKLISTSPDSKPVEGRHRWFDYKLVEPVFVTKVVTNVTGYSDYHEFEFKWSDANGREKGAIGKLRGESVEIEVNDLCRRFSFRPPAVFFTNPSILSVQVFGLESGSVASALDHLSLIEEYKDRVIDIAETAV